MSLKQFLALIALCVLFGCSGNTSTINEPQESGEPPENEDPESSSSEENSSSSVSLQSSSSSVSLSSSSAMLSSNSVSSSSVLSSSSSSSIRSSSSARSSSSNPVVQSSSSIAQSSSSNNSSSSSIATDGLQIDCTRPGLTNAVNSYIEALSAGDYTKMPLASAARYIENDHNAPYNGNRTVAFGEGLWKTPLTPDYHMNLIDVEACATFTEVILANTSTKYVLGVRLTVKDNKISEVFAVVTYDGHWLFNAKNYLQYSKAEDWSVLPVEQRLTRERLRDDAEAYFKYFNDKTVEVPWGIQCARLEGGAYTGDRPNSTCNVGVPNTQKIPTIWWLADVDHGMVVLYVFFGGPDSHLFRILPTGYRYIHTLTAMLQSDFQP